MSNIVQKMISLGKTLEGIEDRTHDLWTHLPSYQVAKKYHGDYAMEFRPSSEDVMGEACEFIYALSQHAEKEHGELVERMKQSYMVDFGGQCLCGEFHDTTPDEQG